MTHLARLFPIALIALSAATLGAQAGGDKDAEAGSKPSYDVLFLPIDDLNDWVGFLGGGPASPTPAIDRLARLGVVFSHAYAPAPACNPSRTAVLTGIPPHRSGLYLNHQSFREVLPDAVTIPEHFRAHDYQALGGGKIFHHTYPATREWDLVFNSLDNPLPPGWARKEKLFRQSPHFDWEPLPAPLGRMGDWRLALWAARILEDPPEQPMFLGAGIYRPHLPWHVPKAFFDAFPLEEVELPLVREDDLDDVPAIGRAMAGADGDHKAIVESGSWKAAVQGYLASIHFADRCVARIVSSLLQSPRAKRTIIVLWGDHGWNLGEKEHWRKHALWEDTTRVPLIIIAPGVSVAGSICDQPVGLIDLYATLIELCGLPEREGISGRSLVPLLRDPQREDWEERPVLSTYGRGNHALRDRRWRYIRYADGGEELYDHQADPHEWTNLAGLEEYAQVKERLAKSLPAEEAPGPTTTERPRYDGKPREEKARRPRKGDKESGQR